MVCPHCNADLIPFFSGPYDLADHARDIGFVCCKNCQKPVPAVSLARPTAPILVEVERHPTLFELPEAA